MKPQVAGSSNPRPDTQCLGGTDGRRPAAEPLTPASVVLPSRFAGRDSGALARVGVRYTLYPHLSTAIHKEKKKQKEKGPADEGSIPQSNDRTLLKNGKADISILLQQEVEKSVQAIKAHVAERLAQFSGDRGEMSRGLRQDLSKYAADIDKQTKAVLGEARELVHGFAREKTMRSAEWQGMAAAMAKKKGAQAPAVRKSVRPVPAELPIPQALALTVLREVC